MPNLVYNRITDFPAVGTESGGEDRLNRKNPLRKMMLYFLIMIFFTSISHSESSKVYIVNLIGEVNPGMLSYASDAFREANENGADLILLNIDTLGGRIDVAEKLSRLIMESEAETAAYVNTKAESAGVLLSISADHLYMAPASTIGSAETIPNTEKTLSYWRSLLESTAEKKGRDPEIAAAMADSSLQIEELVEKGKLLNLTGNKAEEIGFSDGTAASREEIYDLLKLKDPSEIEIEMSNSNKILGFLASVTVSQIMLTIGFIGLAVEIMTPGFGVGGAVSMIGFALFFAGSILSGSAGSFAAVVFVLGIILLLIEFFVPGFGFFGVSGILCVFGSIIMVSPSVTVALTSIGTALLFTVLVIAGIFRFLPKRSLSKTLFLHTKLDKESGFSASKEEKAYVGREGRTLTFLRPSGKIIIDGKMLEAISEGRYIEKEKAVLVIRAEGGRLVVKEKEEKNESII